MHSGREWVPSSGAVSVPASDPKLPITHSITREGAKLIEAVSGGWPKIVSSLKSLLAGGTIALEEADPSARTATARK